MRVREIHAEREEPCLTPSCQSVTCRCQSLNAQNPGDSSRCPVEQLGTSQGLASNLCGHGFRHQHQTRCVFDHRSGIQPLEAHHPRFRQVHRRKPDVTSGWNDLVNSSLPAQQAGSRHPKQGLDGLGHRSIAVDQLGSNGVNLLVTAHLSQSFVHLQA